MDRIRMMRKRAALGIAVPGLLLVFADTRAQALAGWKFHKDIKINTSASGANVPGKVDRYPLAVILEAPGFDFAQAKDDGSDIRFTKPDGSPLPHEIESWDKAGKSAAIWVKADVLGNSASQAIAMHWGKADAPNTSDGKAVFATGDGWLGVWHLSETGGTAADLYRDATPSEAHGTGKATTASNTVAGRVGRAHLNVRADKNWIRIRDDKKEIFNPKTPAWTITVWTKVTSWPTGTYQNVMSKGDNSWTLQRSTAEHAFQHCTAATPYHVCSVTSNIQTPIGTWHLLSAVWVKESYLESHYDGKAVDRTRWSGDGTNWSNWRVGTEAVGLCNQARGTGEADRWWDGAIDEARVKEGVQSPDWVLLDYESQREGSRLLEFGENTPAFVRRTLPGYLTADPGPGPRAHDLLGRLLAPLPGTGSTSPATSFIIMEKGKGK